MKYGQIGSKRHLTAQSGLRHRVVVLQCHAAFEQEISGFGRIKQGHISLFDPSMPWSIKTITLDQIRFLRLISWLKVVSEFFFSQLPH